MRPPTELKGHVHDKCIIVLSAFRCISVEYAVDQNGLRTLVNNVADLCGLFRHKPAQMSPQQSAVRAVLVGCHSEQYLGQHITTDDI